MVKIIRLTEADLTILIKKIVNEQERIDDPSDKYFMEIDYIANYAIDEAMEPEDIEAAIDEISDIMGEADSDEDLSDDELDEVISYGGEVIRELEGMLDSQEPRFENNETLYEDEYGSVQSIDYNKEFINEAEYQGRMVQLGKVMQGDVKKSKVYVRKPNGNIVKVNFGDKKMRIKKSNPARRKSFRARHNCANPGPRHKARYWSCRSW